MSTRTPAGDKGTADRIEADDGGYWVRLVTWQALDREGACMQHCVGNGEYDRLVGGEDLHDNAIWSLRDRDGVSVLTVRIWERAVNYAKGFSNHAPGRGAAMQVRHLAAAFKAAGHDLKVRSDTGIVLLEDGRTFRRDRLPLEVRAERDASQRRYEIGTPTVMVRPASAPPGTPFIDMGAIGPGGGGDPYFALTRDFSGPSNEEFLRAYNAAIERAARARPPEQAEPACPGGGGGQGSAQSSNAPARAIETINIEGGVIFAGLSDGEIVPLAYVSGITEGTTVTGHDSIGETLMVFLSKGMIHEVPHPAPLPVNRVTIGGPQGWHTVLGEQASEAVHYGPSGGGGGPAVPTVALGDTQPAPAVETSTDAYGPFVEHVRRHLAEAVGQSYEEFTGDWRATAERADLALLAEHIQARDQAPPAPTAKRSFVMITTSRLKDTLFRRLTSPGARP